MKKLLKWQLLLCLSFQILRFVFILSHIPFNEWLLNDWLLLIKSSLRFDLSLASYFLALLVPLGFAALSTRPKIQKMALSLLIIFLVFCLTSHVVDYFYFPFSGFRISYEYFNYFVDLPQLATVALQSKPFASVFTVFLFFTLLFLFYRNSTKILKHIPHFKNYFLLLVIIPYLVICIRGGIQRVPLRVGDSLVSRKNSLNQSVSNPSYRVLRSLSKKSFPKLIQADLAKKNFNKIKNSYKGSSPFQKEKFNNLVLIILESWSSSLTNLQTYKGVNIAPYFQKLKGEGHYFTNFFANGFRSSTSVFSSLSCQSDLPNTPILQRPELWKLPSSLSLELEKKGFENYFFLGEHLDWDNLNAFLNKNHFHKSYGLKFFNKHFPKKLWNTSDLNVFQFMSEELKNNLKNPFFAFMFTTSTHPPFDIPAEYKILSNKQPMEENEKLFVASLNYSDLAIKNFIESNRKKDWFHDTLFVFVADHTAHILGSKIKKFHVPLLLWSPKLKAKTIQTLASHYDILPTIAPYFDLDTSYCMGKNLYSHPPAEHFAYSVSSDSFEWRRPSGKFEVSLNGEYQYTPAFNSASLSHEEILAEVEMAKSWYQESVRRRQNNNSTH